MHPAEEDAFRLSIEQRKVKLLQAIADAVGADTEAKNRCPRCNLFVSDVDAHQEDCPGSRQAMRMLQNPNELAAYLGDDGDESEADDEPEQGNGSDGEDVEPPFDPDELLVSDLEDRLDDTEYSDAELEALLTAEREGRDRSTAVNAIESQMGA